MDRFRLLRHRKLRGAGLDSCTCTHRQAARQRVSRQAGRKVSRGSAARVNTRKWEGGGGDVNTVTVCLCVNRRGGLGTNCDWRVSCDYSRDLTTKKSPPGRPGVVGRWVCDLFIDFVKLTPLHQSTKVLETVLCDSLSYTPVPFPDWRSLLFGAIH